MFPIENDHTSGDLRRGRMHHSAIGIKTPWSPRAENPAELSQQMVNQARFVLETAINTAKRKGFEGMSMDEALKLVAFNLAQKMRQRAYKGEKTGKGPWQKL